jgi:hypothetical protein
MCDRKEQSMKSPPPLWQRFTAFLELSQADSRRWWGALVRSTWSRPTELRQKFVLMEGCAWFDREHFAHTATSPGNLVATLEELVTTRLLTRAEATRIEEAIFRKTVPERKRQHDARAIPTNP